MTTAAPSSELFGVFDARRVKAPELKGLDVAAHAAVGAVRNRMPTLAGLRRMADRVERLEAAVKDVTEAKFREEVEALRDQARLGRLDARGLDYAFALAREGAKRTLGKRPYPVQIMGAAAMHLGLVAEMATGEGKTLTAAVAAAVMAWAGRPVHVITVNDYLVARDAELNAPFYKVMGLRRRAHRPRHQPPRAARRLPPQRRLHHEQGDGRRLPARPDHARLAALQHPDRHRPARRRHRPRRDAGPAPGARPVPRDRRRGRLAAGRRGRHAPDHQQQPDRGAQRRPLPRRRRPRPRAAEGPGLLRRQGDQARRDDRPRPPEARRPRRRRQLLEGPAAAGGAGHAVAGGPALLPPRRALPHHARRQDRDRRRVHRPRDGRPILAGRAAPGGGDQGGRARHGRQGEPRPPELPAVLPPVPRDGRHDRHRVGELAASCGRSTSGRSSASRRTSRTSASSCRRGSSTPRATSGTRWSSACAS